MEGTQRRVHSTSVVRVRPRTSRSIIDLLLALPCVHLANMHGTREKQHTGTLRRVIYEPWWDRRAGPWVRCSGGSGKKLVPAVGSNVWSSGNNRCWG